MTTTMEQMEIQLQQELFTLKAPVAARVQIAAAVQVVNNLTAAHVVRDAPSLINAKDLGRPGILWQGRGQHWSKETKALFAGVTKESEVMLEWAAEQTTEISTELIDREFRSNATDQEREARNLELILQQIHAVLADFTMGEAKDIVANSRKNPLEAWRRLQKRYDPNSRRKAEKPSSLCRFSGTMLSSGKLQAGNERWESAVSQYEKMGESKMNDEIKLAGLEALVPEELGKHRILNSNRLRTFEHVGKS